MSAFRSKADMRSGAIVWFHCRPRVVPAGSHQKEFEPPRRAVMESASDILKQCRFHTLAGKR
jgi:hypothetical protein